MDISITHEAARAVIFWFCAVLLIGIVHLWLIYFIIKKAIEHGIRDSGLVDATRRRQMDTIGAHKLPKMTTD